MPAKSGEAETTASSDTVSDAQGDSKDGVDETATSHSEIADGEAKISPAATTDESTDGRTTGGQAIRSAYRRTRQNQARRPRLIRRRSSARQGCPDRGGDSRRRTRSRWTLTVSVTACRLDDLVTGARVDCAVVVGVASDRATSTRDGRSGEQVPVRCRRRDPEPVRRDWDAGTTGRCALDVVTSGVRATGIGRDLRPAGPHSAPAGAVTTTAADAEPEERTLILSAFPAEADAVLARTTLDPNPAVVVDGHHFYLGTLGGKKVIVAMTGIGMVNATRDHRGGARPLHAGVRHLHWRRRVFGRRGRIRPHRDRLCGRTGAVDRPTTERHGTRSMPACWPQPMDSPSTWKARPRWAIPTLRVQSSRAAAVGRPQTRAATVRRRRWLQRRQQQRCRLSRHPVRR